jgi:DNA-binding CsgD family transcriptional regulator
LLPADAIHDPFSRFSAQLDVLRELAEEIHQSQRAPLPSQSGVQILDDLEGPRAHQGLIRTATTGIRGTTRLPVVGGPLWRQTSNVIEVLKSGRTWRGIYDNAAIQHEEILVHLRDAGAVGEQSRTVPRVPLKMVIADNTRALVAIENDGAAYHLLVAQCGLLTDLIDLFESLWSFGTPVPNRTATGDEPHTPFSDERDLLCLLAAGATDEAIARQLGMSLRTVQRRVRRLEDMLGAHTRFQAGIQAARLHLI